MICNIRREDKIIICVFIEYYRVQKEITDDRFKIANFIIDDYDDYICSPSYYVRIRSKSFIALDDMYLGFLDNLSMKYSYDKELSNIINKLNIQLLDNVEYNRSEKIASTLTKAMKVLNRIDNTIIYHEISEMYLLIHDYYILNEYHQDLIDKYISLLDVVPAQLKPIIVTIAYQYYSRENIKIEYSLEIIKLSEQYNDNRVIFRYIKGVYLIRCDKFINAYDECKMLQMLCERSNNNYYLAKTYNLLALLGLKKNSNESIPYLEKALDCYPKGTINEDTKAFMMNIIILLFEEGNYKKCIENCKLAISMDEAIINYISPYFIGCFILYEASESEMNFTLHLINTHLPLCSPYFKCINDLLTQILLDPSYEKLFPLLHILIKNHKNILEINNNFTDIIKLSLYSILETPNNRKLYNTFIETFT